MGLVRSLLLSHECDTRLTDPNVKARVALLYLPLIGIVLDASSQLFDPYRRGNLLRSSGCYGAFLNSER